MTIHYGFCNWGPKDWGVYETVTRKPLVSKLPSRKAAEAMAQTLDDAWNAGFVKANEVLAERESGVKP